MIGVVVGKSHAIILDIFIEFINVFISKNKLHGVRNSEVRYINNEFI